MSCPWQLGKGESEGGEGAEVRGSVYLFVGKADNSLACLGRTPAYLLGLFDSFY